MQNTPLTLEQVADEFQNWRQNKAHRFEHIPSHLKDLVSNHLIPHYPRTVIARTLNLTKSFISSLQKQHHNQSAINSKKANNKTPNQAQPVDFIPFTLTNNLSALNPFPNNKHNYSTCHIIKANGTKLVIQTLDPKAIIHAFLCSN
jgi:hypothetical protein